MTETPDAPDPLAADRAVLDAAIIANEAATALNQVGCVYVDLFGPQVEQFLRRAADGSIDVVDDGGAVRAGVTALRLALEVRQKWDRSHKGKFFK